MAPRPSWIDKFNFITFYLFNHCDIDLRIYFETAWDATGNLSWTLLSFGMDDVARGLFRPRGLRTQRHGRRGRKGRPREAIPEIGEMIGRNMDADEVLPSRRIDSGLRHMWTWDGLGQRLLYYMMLIDVVEDFWIDWNTAIIRNPRSQCPDIARLVRKGDEFYATGSFWLAMSLPTLVLKNVITTEDQFGCLVPGGKFFAVLSCKVKNNTHLPYVGQYQIRLYIGFADRRHYDYSVRVELAPGETADLVARSAFVGPTLVGWEMFKLTTTPGGGVEGHFTDIEAFVYQVDD